MLKTCTSTTFVSPVKSIKPGELVETASPLKVENQARQVVNLTQRVVNVAQ